MLLLRIDNLLATRHLLQQHYQQELLQSRLVEHTGSEQDDTANLFTTKVKGEQAQQQFNAKLSQVLAKHYTDAEFDVSQLAQQMALSQRQFTRKTNSLLNATPMEVLRNYRLQRAAELLQQGEVPSMVYHQVGFVSHSHFSQRFKVRFGCTPSVYSSR